ncbi:hypothetical protein NV64_03030, partial [Erwinia sp. B116]
TGNIKHISGFLSGHLSTNRDQPNSVTFTQLCQHIYQQTECVDRNTNIMDLATFISHGDLLSLSARFEDGRKFAAAKFC